MSSISRSWHSAAVPGWISLMIPIAHLDRKLLCSFVNRRSVGHSPACLRAFSRHTCEELVRDNVPRLHEG